MTASAASSSPQYSLLPQKFTGKERDETGLDYFGARYFSGAMGRFTSPDDFQNDTTTRDPKSWNLYTYVRNNPLQYIDPNGEYIFVGELSTDYLDKLLQKLNFTYGCTSCVSEVNKIIQLDTTGLSAAILQANKYLTDLIRDPDIIFTVRGSDHDDEIAFAQFNPANPIQFNGKMYNTGIITMDFYDDQWVKGDIDAVRSFVDLMFAHEVAHGYPTLLVDPKEYFLKGPVVEKVNHIRDALGLPERAEYLSSPHGSDFLSIWFTKKSVDKNGKTKEKKVLLNWQLQQVGGIGIN